MGILEKAAIKLAEKQVAMEDQLKEQRIRAKEWKEVNGPSIGKRMVREKDLGNGFCRKCGTPIRSGALFCHRCGEKVPENEEE